LSQILSQTQSLNSLESTAEKSSGETRPLGHHVVGVVKEAGLAVQVVDNDLAWNSANTASWVFDQHIHSSHISLVVAGGSDTTVEVLLDSAGG